MFIIEILGFIFLGIIIVKLVFLLSTGIFYLFINIGDYIEDKRIEKLKKIKANKELKEKRCKNCKYWLEDNGEYSYNDNFGYCFCKKIGYREDIEKEHDYDVDEEEYNKYNLIYSDSEGLNAELRVHKNFGCVNFEKIDEENFE